jgi:chaperonin GroEL (HSP60 family)
LSLCWKCCRDGKPVRHLNGSNAVYLDVEPAVGPYFVTNAEKMLAELDEPHILLHEKKLSSLQSLLPLLESAVKSGSRC